MYSVVQRCTAAHTPVGILGSADTVMYSVVLRCTAAHTPVGIPSPGRQSDVRMVTERGVGVTGLPELADDGG